MIILSRGREAARLVAHESEESDLVRGASFCGAHHEVRSHVLKLQASLGRQAGAREVPGALGMQCQRPAWLRVLNTALLS